MFNWLLRLFGFGKKTETVTETASLPKVESTAMPAVTPAVGGTPTPTRKNVDRTKYYRKNGNFYSIDDDSLIDDLLMLAILVEMFNEPDYVPQEDVVVIDDSAAEAAAIDASVERESKVVVAPEYVAPEPSYTPEPTRSYATGSDYSSSDSSSSYDSGGSDSSSD